VDTILYLSLYYLVNDLVHLPNSTITLHQITSHLLWQSKCSTYCSQSCISWEN